MSKRGKEEASSTTLECCMCGDYGLPDELFRCKICFFRFQHRYCSDLYPKAESHRVCNWCLTRKGRKMMEAPHNSSTSANKYNKTRHEELQSKNRRKSNNSGDNDDELNGVKAQRGSVQLHLQNPMKKKRSPGPEEQRSSTKTRNFKRIISNGCLEETLRRTKSEEIIPKTTTTTTTTTTTRSRGITKQVFRGKVRRYKLLDEVST